MKKLWAVTALIAAFVLGTGLGSAITYLKMKPEPVEFIPVFTPTGFVQVSMPESTKATGPSSGYVSNNMENPVIIFGLSDGEGKLAQLDAVHTARNDLNNYIPGGQTVQFMRMAKHPEYALLLPGDKLLFSFADGFSGWVKCEYHKVEADGSIKGEASFTHGVVNLPVVGAASMEEAHAKLISAFSLDLDRFYQLAMGDVAKLRSGEESLPSVNNTSSLIGCIGDAERQHQKLGAYFPLQLVRKDGREVVLGFYYRDGKMLLARYLLDPESGDWTERVQRK